MDSLIEHLRRAVLAEGKADLTDGQLLDDYISNRDEAAVAALVRRHGPMVWGVCRRVLRNQHDAEDAFQATFLVLVRKAASVLPREMVGNWLYGVAHQTALKARATAAKRQGRERQVKGMPEPAVTPEPDLWANLEPLLDQELSRLPDKYRVAIVLCDLEGKTRKEVAQQLKIPEGTLSSRLTTARKMLAKRLARHGLVLSGGALAALAQQTTSACVPPAVLSSTIRAATLVAAGQAAATGAISVKVAALTEGVMRTMLLTKLKVVMAVFIVAGLTGAAGLIYRTQAGESAKALLTTENADWRRRPAANEGKGDSKDKPDGENKVMKALEKLQGMWVLASAEEHGRAVPEEAVKRMNMTLTIKDARFILRVSRGNESKTMEGKLTIDPITQPATMDWSALKPEDEKNLNLKGIYSVEDDTLKFCYGEERPTEFKTKPEPPPRELDQRMFVFKRKKR